MGEGMNLQQCWFRFQRATTKPLERHSRDPSLLAVTKHSLCLIGSLSDLIKIQKTVELDPRAEHMQK